MFSTILLFLFLLFSSAKAQNPLRNGGSALQIGSMDSKPSIFRFFSGLARGCRPSHIIDTKGLIFTNSKPISTKSSFSYLSRLIQVDHHIKIVSENFIRSNLRISSPFTSTLEPVISADINRPFSTDFKRILLKISFPSSSNHDAADGSANFESSFENSFFWENFQCFSVVWDVCCMSALYS